MKSFFVYVLFSDTFGTRAQHKILSFALNKQINKKKLSILCVCKFEEIIVMAFRKTFNFGHIKKEQQLVHSTCDRPMSV